MDTKGKKIGAISLGCDKNRVDLEKMLFQLKENGFEIVANEEDANLIIINTCAFIEIARKESIQTILDICALKDKGSLEKIIVTGCLPQKNFEEMKTAIPEVDAFLKIKDNERIVEEVCKLLSIENYKIKKSKSKLQRILTTVPSYAFLKISDGCNNFCSYCTIPRIRGRYTSVPMNELIDEAIELANKGVKELVIIAQDITRYGSDLPEQTTLIELIHRLSNIDGIEWIRLHYCYPEKVDDELLNEIKNNPKVCKYIDVPFQHIDDEILKSMNRRSNEEQIRTLVKKIRTSYPEIAIRTTFIIGLPGETRKAFKKLCEFVKESSFEMAGFFAYSREEGTKAYYMPKQVNNFIKYLRLKKINKIQATSLNKFISKIVGQEYKVLVDSFDEEKMEATGRTEFFSPEVDFVIKFPSKNILVSGEYVLVKITQYDMDNFKGEIV
ncbi:MAG: 30S ribosomal protein S12 methylthiotransferase RimO [Clostridia bacterium]